MPDNTHIRIQNLEVECLIGVWPHERNTPQRIRVDMAIELDTSAASQSEKLDQTINYAWLADSVRFILQSGRFLLLESALECLHRWALLPPLGDQTQPRVQSSHVTMTKFNALPGGATAVVESRRVHSDFDYEIETKSWGSVDIIFETSRCGFYRLNIHAGDELPMHYHNVMREQEWVICGELDLLQSGQSPQRLAVEQWIEFPKEHRHGYRNVGQQTASLLCMDSPPFNHDDEILVTP